MGCSKRTSSLDFGCIVKIFENHVVIGELLELKATQHDIKTINSLPTDVNWNTGSEASQVTGGYTQFSLEQSHRVNAYKSYVRFREQLQKLLQQMLLHKLLSLQRRLPRKTKGIHLKMG